MLIVRLAVEKNADGVKIDTSNMNLAVLAHTELAQKELSKCGKRKFINTFLVLIEGTNYLRWMGIYKNGAYALIGRTMEWCESKENHNVI